MGQCSSTTTVTLTGSLTSPGKQPSGSFPGEQAANRCTVHTKLVREVLAIDELWDLWSYKAHINETGDTSYRLTQTIR